MDHQDYVAPTIATWWLPLPEPISLETDEMFAYVEPRKTVELPTEPHALSVGDPRLKHEIEVKFHQEEVPYAPSLGLQASMTAAHKTTNDTAALRAHQETGSQHATVAEVSVTMHGIPEPDFDDLSEAFDTGLEIVRHIQRAYALAAQLPSVLIEHERLPTFVPYSIHNEGELRPEPQGLYMLGYNEVAAFTKPEPLSHEARNAFELLKGDAEGPFVPFLHYYQRAQAERLRLGDHRSAVLSTATAAELLLDDLLLVLLWEGVNRPEDAAPHFTEPGMHSIVKRLETHYEPLLRSTWSPSTPGPLHDWRASVHEVRNRIAHAGYRPTRHESEQAINALNQLAAHADNSVLGVLHRYPRTALMLISAPRLKAMGKYTKRVRRVQEDDSEVNWRETFVRWREALMRERDRREGGGTAPSEERAVTIVVPRRDGLDWLLHDETSGMAAKIDSPWERLTSEARTMCEEIRAAVPPGQASFAFHGIETPRRTEEWVAEHRRVPGRGVMVDRSDSY